MDNQELIHQISEMFKEQNSALSFTIQKEFSRMDAKIDKLDERMGNLESRVTGIELTIENEIRDDIKLLAEGQATILAQLNRLNGVPERVDVLETRANWHESEIRELRKAL